MLLMENKEIDIFMGGSGNWAYLSLCVNHKLFVVYATSILTHLLSYLYYSTSDDERKYWEPPTCQNYFFCICMSECGLVNRDQRTIVSDHLSCSLTGSLCCFSPAYSK